MRIYNGMYSRANEMETTTYLHTVGKKVAEDYVCDLSVFMMLDFCSGSFMKGFWPRVKLLTMAFWGLDKLWFLSLKMKGKGNLFRRI